MDELIRLYKMALKARCVLVQSEKGVAIGTRTISWYEISCFDRDSKESQGSCLVGDEDAWKYLQKK